MAPNPEAPSTAEGKSPLLPQQHPPRLPQPRPQALLTSGILSKDMMLATESAEAFDALKLSTSPPASTRKNEVELILARSFAMAALRLNRIWDVQHAALHEQVARNPELTGAQGTLKAMDALLQPGQVWNLYRRYEVTTKFPAPLVDTDQKLLDQGNSPVPFEPDDPMIPPASTTSEDPRSGTAAAEPALPIPATDRPYRQQPSPFLRQTSPFPRQPPHSGNRPLRPVPSRDARKRSFKLRTRSLFLKCYR